MEDYPKTIFGFEKSFTTEEECRQYLYKIRWPEGFCCPRCNHRKVWITKRGLYRCANCDFMVSVTAGTIFQDLRLPLRLWFQAIWYVVSQKNGVSALGLQNSLGLGSYHTAWEWLHKLRRAMVRPGRDKLNGIVEINETMIGGEKPGKRGRGAEGKTSVLIAAEETQWGIGRIRMASISDASRDVLDNTIQQMVELGSTIRTDGWAGYSGLNKLGYTHLPMVNPNVKEEDLIEQAHLVAALLKRWLLGTLHGAINPKNLPYYLDEFTFS